MGRSACFTLGILLTGPFALADGPFVDLSFDDACKKAAEENKLIFIDFYTTWCPPCKMMDQSTFRDESVVSTLTEKFVSLKVDAEKHRELAKRFGVRAYPTLLFVKPDGTPAGRMMGFRDARSFTSDALAILSGEDPAAKRRRELEEAANSNDPMARMQFARQLMIEGKQAEALEQLLWCFDHGLEAGPAFYGVRLSFLLGTIEQLGRKYPPAREALIQRRDQAEAQLSAGDATSQTFHDYSALNRTLREDARTMKVFDGLSAADRDRLGATAVVQNLLLEAKRYDEIVEDDEDVAQLISVAASHLREAKTASIANPSAGIPRQQQAIAASRRRYAISSAGDAIEILAGAEQTDHAKALVDDVLAFDSSGTTRAQLLAHARRAENADVIAYIEQWSAQASVPPATQSSAR